MYKFSDLVDIPKFTEVLDSFYKATQIPNGLVGEEGEIISQSGWVDACALYHRANPHSNQHCIQSNLELMSNLHEGQVAYSFCKNGLIDYATPVVIEGQRIATLFLGQVLDKEPDILFFQEQYKKFDYDKDAYLKAIHDIPIVPKEQMEALMECMVGMARILAESGLAKLRQNILENDLDKSMAKRIQLEDILNLSPIGIGWSNVDGTIEYINHQFTKLFGYTLEDIPDLEHWYHKAYPDASYRARVIVPWQEATAKASRDKTHPPELEAKVTCKDGSMRYVAIRVSWIGEKRLVNFSDMTAHWKSEQRNKAHDSMLEMIAKGSPLPNILHAIVLEIESEEPSSKCSILLLDDEGKHLYNGASITLPDFYNKAIDGIEIGVGVGSCGSAAYLKERVIVEDIMTHAYWEPYKALAKEAHLGACWSEPIMSSNQKVLGTFAIYHETPTKPTQADIERISFAANLAAIAIENRNTHTKLEQQAYFDYLTQLANRRSFIERSETELIRSQRYGGAVALIMFDIDYFKKINDKYGHHSGDLVLKKIAAVSRATLREIDIIGRIGGEEFAVLLPHTSASEAMQAAERLRIAIAAADIALAYGDKITFTASFGVTALKNVTIGIDALLHQADMALYQAKADGRNKVCFI